MDHIALKRAYVKQMKVQSKYYLPAEKLEDEFTFYAFVYIIPPFSVATCDSCRLERTACFTDGSCADYEAEQKEDSQWDISFPFPESMEWLVMLNCD